jgi:DNA-binding XRE family transcriptional regulator
MRRGRECADAPTSSLRSRPYDSGVAEDGDARIGRAFGARLRGLRKRQGLTQSDVAERAQVSLVYVSQIERGLRNPTLAVVLRLARAVDVTPCDLIAGLDESR